MDVTLRGAAGVCVAGHVTGDISVVLVPVPIPRQNSVDETAGDWDLLHSHSSVTHKNAQVITFFIFLSFYPVFENV